MTTKVKIWLGLLTAGVLLGILLNGWLSTNLLHLTLLNKQRNEPFTVLSLARGVESDIYTSRVILPLTDLLASEGGHLIDRYEMQQLFDGPRSSGWRYLSRLHMQQARDIAKVMTATPYRSFPEIMPKLERRMLGGFREPEPVWRETLVLWLLQVDDPSRVDPSLDELVALLSEYDGRLVWDATPIVLAGRERWDRAFVVDFERAVEARAWLRDPDVATLRAIVNARVQRMTVSLYQAKP